MPVSDDLLMAVEALSVVHDRYDSEHSDPTGTGNTGGDDGDNKDGANHPKQW